MRFLVPAVAIAGVAPAAAAGIQVSVEIPKLDVAEYHRPYVAVWIEKADQSVAANLAVWYDVKLKDREGEKWLKDMRQWWRRIGRSLELPADGVSGATRAPGTETLTFQSGGGPLPELDKGAYVLVVEAAREVGGREIVRIPFEWSAAQELSAQGTSELGAVKLTVTP